MHSPITAARVYRAVPFLCVICLFLITAASAPAQTPSLSINDATTNEADPPFNNEARFTITLSAPSQQTVQVTASTQAGTATSDVDFVAGSTTITFAPGQTSSSLSVFTKGDTAVEGTENFFVNLSNPVNATIAHGQGVCTIVDDDSLALLNQSTVQRGASLDSVLFTTEPFPIQRDNNFNPDHLTRIIVFATGLKLANNETASAVTATAEDSQGTVRPLVVEFVGNVPTYDWLTQVNLKLNDQIALTGDIKVKITLHGASSNTILVAVKPQ
jgi:hypothetical protein